MHVLHYQLLQAFVQLWAKLMETADALRIDLSKLPGSKTMFTSLLEKRELEDMIAWSDEMIGDMCTYIREAFSEKKINYIQEVRLNLIISA